MHLHRAFALAREIHGIQIVTIAALQRVVGFQPCPLVLRKLQTLIKKFLAGADGAENFPPDFFRSLHLARNLVSPIVRYVAVGAGCTYTRAIAVVNGGLQLDEYVLAHFMAAGAKGFSIGHLQCGIESAPEHDAGNESTHGQKAKREHLAGR